MWNWYSDWLSNKSLETSPPWPHRLSLAYEKWHLPYSLSGIRGWGGGHNCVISAHLDNRESGVLPVSVQSTALSLQSLPLFRAHTSGTFCAPRYLRSSIVTVSRSPFPNRCLIYAQSPVSSEVSDGPWDASSRKTSSYFPSFLNTGPIFKNICWLFWRRNWRCRPSGDFDSIEAWHGQGGLAFWRSWGFKGVSGSFSVRPRIPSELRAAVFLLGLARHRFLFSGVEWLEVLPSTQVKCLRVTSMLLHLVTSNL